MKTIRLTFLLLAFALQCNEALAAPVKAGFFLPDSLTQFSFRYRSIDNLIILPVRINDTITVNLILDTGCRNIVLFGKRFTELLTAAHNKEIQFSGVGKGKPVTGYLSLENNVSIEAVEGKRIPIIVVPNRSIFSNYPKIDGVIGYEIFSKFEVEIDFRDQRITFRSALVSSLPPDFALIPIRIEDSKPYIDCRMILGQNTIETCDLFIDTGSTLGLLLTTPEKQHFLGKDNKTSLGRGFNGLVEGNKTITKQLYLSGFQIKNISTGIVYSTTHHYASIGTEVLKDYVLILNYSKTYAALKPYDKNI